MDCTKGLQRWADADGTAGRTVEQSSYLPSAEQFYIGGAYSVRGYKESLLGGDHGVAVSLEYSVPIAKAVSAFTFMITAAFMVTVLLKIIY